MTLPLYEGLKDRFSKIPTSNDDRRPTNRDYRHSMGFPSFIGFIDETTSDNPPGQTHEAEYIYRNHYHWINMLERDFGHNTE
ncbi:hypothetical protein DPMN_090432 [Dreissena polymorpha]|uniref:Uncharacterized protein n=1 Tax=Dreissena polymorpha TaxID=45954 RepID=A0A9D4QYB3_DREPO|nr:hypothetical protein DPMN_090432 [Dreissena polymorpha]